MKTRKYKKYGGIIRPTTTRRITSTNRRQISDRPPNTNIRQTSNRIAISTNRTQTSNRIAPTNTRQTSNRVASKKLSKPNINIIQISKQREYKIPRFNQDIDAFIKMIENQTENKDEISEPIKFPKANLERADLTGVHLNGAILTGAFLKSAKLQGAHLEGAQLQGAHLEGANLFGSYLHRANLIGAHLEGAHLNFANLEGANLKDAHLESAILEAANLKDATFEGAYLEDAKLHSAISKQLANFKGAHFFSNNFEINTEEDIKKNCERNEEDEDTDLIGVILNNKLREKIPIIKLEDEYCYDITEILGMFKKGSLKNYPMNGLPISIKDKYKINKLIENYKKKKSIK